jgi:glycerol-3-phosphate dehydrogenase
VAAYDLLIIGGGINGLGIAADAAARGFSVLLVEKGDIGGGTTAASSRLIHGGLRYLQYGEIPLVRESLRERGLLARQRPHLVRPIHLLIPAFQGDPKPAWMIGAGLLLYDLLARDPFFPRSARRSRRAVAEQEPGLAVEGLHSGFLYPDAQIEFPERLCVELRRETLERGGEVLTYTRVTRLLSSSGRVQGAVVRDELTRAEREIRARLTVNAAGPWVDCVTALLPEPPPRLIGGTRGTHLILPAREGGPRGPFYASARKDGRPVFLLPWDGRLLVGTTDVPVEGDPDEARCEPWETEYLLAETNRLFPACGYSPDDIQYTTVGVRPLLRSDRAAPAVSRRHFLIDHGARHGLEGLASVVGGKLTTYRSLAEEVVDWAVRRLGGHFRPCASRNVAAGPAGEPLEREARTALAAAGLDPTVAHRWIRLYGAGFREVVRHADSAPALAAPLLPGCPALAAEVAHAVRCEGARTVDDVLLRRLMLIPPSPAVRAAVEELMPGT